MVFCVFVMYDTQLIVDKFERGDHDYIWYVVLFNKNITYIINTQAFSGAVH